MDTGNPKLTVRLPRLLAAQFVTAAHNAGTNAAGLIKQFIYWWMGVPGAELPPRPPQRLDVDSVNHPYL